MFDYYTNVICQGNNILYRGVKNGRRYSTKIEYSPTLFLLSNKESKWKNLRGENLEPISFEGIKEARNFVKQYSDVENFKIFGNSQFQYAYIADNFPKQVEWDISNIAIDVIDIEVGQTPDGGFPEPYLANAPITAICVTRLNGATTVFGCGDYIPNGSEKYIQCRDEYTLCKKFLEFWSSDYPDILSGWYIKFFDIPYLVNRINKILGEDEARKLSPWKSVYERKAVMKGREQIAYQLEGVAVLDYMELYRWYATSPTSSNRLDIVANHEIGKRKLSYDEYDSLHKLYEQNYQRFLEYNIQDVQLIIELDEKLKLFELAIGLAYDTKSNFEDVFSQTRMWDSLINCYLLERKIVVPPKSVSIKNEKYEGAYVKEPVPGLYRWVVSFDVTSMHPSNMIQYNISPETIVEPEDYTDEMCRIISEGVTVDRLLNQEIDLSGLSNVTLTPNGQFFRTDVQGFIPKMLEQLLADRKKYKKLMLDAKRDYEIETDSDKKEDLKKSIARYNNIQMCKKLSLNSIYGCYGSSYFRFFDLRQAIAVTTGSQLAIRWSEKRLNGYLNKILDMGNKDFCRAIDTDSNHFEFSFLVNKVFGDKQQDKEKIVNFLDKICKEKIEPLIEQSYQDLADYTHAYSQAIHSKREKICDGLYTAKKRYVLNVYDNEGVRYAEPQISVTGLEVVKSSTPEILRTKMSELIKIIMTQDEKSVQDYIETFREEFRKLPPEDVAFPRGVNGIAEYSDTTNLYKKGTPIHVKGAILYNHLLKTKKLTTKYQFIKEGEKLKFTYLKLPNPLKDSVISFTSRLPVEFGLHEFVDYEKQFQKAFLDPIQLILDPINWRIEKVNSIESFF